MSNDSEAKLNPEIIHELNGISDAVDRSNSEWNGSTLSEQISSKKNKTELGRGDSDCFSNKDTSISSVVDDNIYKHNSGSSFSDALSNNCVPSEPLQKTLTMNCEINKDDNQTQLVHSNDSLVNKNILLESSGADLGDSNASFSNDTLNQISNSQDLYLSDSMDEDDLDLSEIYDYNSAEESNDNSNDTENQQLDSEMKCDDSYNETVDSAADVNNPVEKSVEVKRKGKRIPKFKRNMVRPAELNFTDLSKLEPGNNECLVCKKTFKLRNKLLAHFSIHPPENPHLFDLSKKDPALVNIDIVPPTPDEIRDKPFACAICPKRFRKYGGLVAHCCVHTGEKPYVCNVCSKTYRDKQYLRGHAMLHKGKVLYECDLCKKSFTRRQNLATHYLTHTGERPHVCDICSQSFRKKNLLVIHYRLHTNEYPFSCKECGRRFRSKRYLVNHAVTHSEDTPFKCHICPKSFSQNRWLVKHIEFHEGKRLHECQECFKCFMRKVDLDFHMTVHTGERPHVCDICRKGFTRPCFLKVHLRTHSEEASSLGAIGTKLNIENKELDETSETLSNPSSVKPSTQTPQKCPNDRYSVLRSMLES